MSVAVDSVPVIIGRSVPTAVSTLTTGGGMTVPLRSTRRVVDFELGCGL
jgi:hypothetical protein